MAGAVTAHRVPLGQPSKMPLNHWRLQQGRWK